MSLDFLRLDDRVLLVPVLHGSGDFAVEIRRLMLATDFDCLAVPLPPSFGPAVEQAIDRLPAISAVLQREPRVLTASDWSPESAGGEDAESQPCTSFVPIDPCQPVITALRIALQENLPRAYIDLETQRYEAATLHVPDPYALKRVSLAAFAAVLLPALPELPSGQPQHRARWMAAQLRRLAQRRRRILALCAMTDWPWIRDAYQQAAPIGDHEEEEVAETETCAVDPQSLLFVLGELPHITGLYEQARSELDDDENLSIDGVKHLLLTARERYRRDLKQRARQISPQMLSHYLKYVRNLSLIERRLTPDLYTLIVAARQIAGDQFAIHLAETAREYPFAPAPDLPTAKFGVGRVRLPDGELHYSKNRLPGPPVAWRSLQLNRRPPRVDQLRWAMQWNPFRHCSWPPEDVAIERFRTHVKDQALNILGADLARTEKFSTSLKDGLDIRETLRNWHTGELYVKVFPPSRGGLDCVLMLFDSPADPRDYPWRITWHAESHDESTLSFFASHFGGEIVGPGIAQALYGGAMFLFPPRSIRDVWRDPQFDFTDTLEERLLAASCTYSEERHIALLSAAPPGAGWRRLAKKYGKRLLHVPLAHFSQETVQQLRVFHVLNGRSVRSYAAHFIRKS